MHKLSMDIKTIKIGLTGGTGVLGSKLVRMLLEEGANVFCFVRKTSNINDMPQQVKLCYGELTDLVSIRAFISQIDICIHLAAQVSPTSTERYYLCNVKGTENICKAILDQNPHCRLINCSSIAAYRIKSRCMMQYTDYAKSKLEADKLVDYYINNKGLRGTTIIPGLIYGPGKNVFVPAIIENLKSNKLFLVEGGEHHVPLSYIDDLCDLFLRAVKNEESVGHKYFGINYTENGIHDFIKMVALKTSCNVPTKVHKKKKLMYKAIFLQLIYSFFKLKGHPRLSIRMVDVLSINYPLTSEQRNNNLGWMPLTDMESGIDSVLNSYDLMNRPKSDKLVTM